MLDSGKERNNGGFIVVITGVDNGSDRKSVEITISNSQQFLFVVTK